MESLEKVKFDKKYLIIAGGALLAMLVILLVLAIARLPKQDKIAAGVRVDGKSVAGMTREQAAEVIGAHDMYSGLSFALTSGNVRRDVTAGDISLHTDVDATVNKAYAVGRDKGLFGNMLVALRSAFGGLNLTSRASADNDSLDTIIFEMGVEKNGEMVEAAVSDLTDTTATVTPPTRGQSHDVSRERAQVLSALEGGNSTQIELSLEPSAPEKMTAQQLYAVIYRPSANAEYSLEDGKLYISDETVGVEPDKDDIASKLSAFNSGSAVTVAVTRTVPEITAASLKNGLFSAELASYKSTYSTAAAGRAYNVARAASSINGKILLPGDTFSYNEAIGNPSLANGYKVAPIFENGKTSEGVGGGVCQVSSTLYSAVLYANLTIVERRNHSLTVAYVPKGQDATVSYGSLDFKFKNDTDHPIRIDASATGGKCIVKIVGTAHNPPQQVTISHTVAASTEPTVIETKDATMPEGTRKVTTAGKTGYVVDSVRTVTENGVVVKTEKLSRSTYKMMPTEVNVGTMPAQTPAAEPTAENVETESIVPTDGE